MKKYNFNIDLTKKNVSIEVLTSIFPAAIILHAAYHFIEEAKVIIDQKKDKVIVALIPEKEDIKGLDLEELAYEFNIQLISSFLENVESERHAGLREALMKAAISPRGPGIRTQPPSPPTKPSPPRDHQEKNDD